MLRVSGLLFFIAALAVPALAAPSATLGSVVDELTRASGAVVLFDERIDTGRAAAPPAAGSLHEMLEEVASASGAFVVAIDETAFLFAPDTPAKRAEYRQRIDSLGGPLPAGEIPVTLSFNSVALGKVLEALGKSTGVRFIFDSRVRVDTPITLDIPQRDLRDALRLVMLQTGLGYTMIDDATLMIAPAPAPRSPVQAKHASSVRGGSRP